MTQQNTHYDVAVIGAGINGASAAQHLVAAGYRVLIVDQADFASGATARSSRLLHCGLRNLASGDSLAANLRPDRLLRALVTAHHDMRARDELVQSIPARLRQVKMCVPIYADDAYSPWQLDAAFAALRLMSPRGVPLDYRRLPVERIESVPPARWLRAPERLKSVALFRVYLFDWPERIALDALFDARRLGADIRNYTRVESLERSAHQSGWRLTLRPTPIGNAPENHAPPTEVTAAMVLNLTGAWIDELVHKVDSTVAPRCNGIRGAHIALRLPPEFSGWGLFLFNRIREPMYCLPMNDFHYVGLTRRCHTDAARDVAASDDEIDWLIGEVNHALPRLGITRQDILFSWAGINPLTRDPAHPLGSREIRLHDYGEEGLPNLLALTGAPIMTHRRMARRIVAAVRRRIAPSMPAGIANLHLDQSSQASGVAETDFDAFRRCVRDEMPAGLSDVLLRRLGAGWTRDQGVPLAEAVGKAFAAEHGWSEQRVESEIAAFRQYLESNRRRPPGCD